MKAHFSAILLLNVRMNMSRAGSKFVDIWSLVDFPKEYWSTGVSV